MSDCAGRRHDLDLPPAGTAIVRPLRHVSAVRERHLAQLAARTLGAESLSARAWSWALGETSTAPVTERKTVVPPSKADMQAEIAVADDRTLNGKRESRADGAARVLRWLVGDDDHLPVRGSDRGELVGGFADVVRSSVEIVELLRIMSVPITLDDPDYREGVSATINWVLDRKLPAPISGNAAPELTTRDLKLERLHAQDLAERCQNSFDSRLPNSFGLGVVQAIDWLLGCTGFWR